MSDADIGPHRAIRWPALQKQRSGRNPYEQNDVLTKPADYGPCYHFFRYNHYMKKDISQELINDIVQCSQEQDTVLHGKINAFIALYEDEKKRNEFKRTVLRDCINILGESEGRI